MTCELARVDQRGSAALSSQILVTYATTYGSTREVAEEVAKTLRESGLGVDLKAVSDAGRPEGYEAVVLGAPLYMFHLHKDALRFLTARRQVLTGMPVAVFALGPAGSPGAEDEWAECRSQLDKELAAQAWLKPAAVELFGGRIDPAKFRFPHTLLAKMPASPLKDAPATDLRDWNAIRSWAEGLPVKLGLE